MGLLVWKVPQIFLSGNKYLCGWSLVKGIRSLRCFTWLHKLWPLQTLALRSSPPVLTSVLTGILPRSGQTAPALALWFPSTQPWLLLMPLPLQIPSSQFLPVQILPILPSPADEKKAGRVVLLSELSLHFCRILLKCVCHSQLSGLHYT